MNDMPAVVGIDLGLLEHYCFVIMPFSPLFKTHYERVIRPAIEESGLRCIRGDEIYSKPRIMDDIWKSIRSARLVVAELTGKNPNVFYEVGLAQAIGKPVIILTRNEDDVPFDLKALRYLYYNVDDPFWGENLNLQLQEMIKSALEEESLSSYLDGIKPISNINFPEKIVITPEPTSPSKKLVPDVVGIWRASYELPERGVESAEKMMNLTQDGEKLIGLEVNTFFVEDVPTVVQEAFTGIIDGKSVTLNGVNYTYIRQGKGAGYSLDNYELELSPDGQQMDGRNVDNVGPIPIPIIYTRIKPHDEL
jgi:hypothetical protein